jgi:hypothetical protein
MEGFAPVVVDVSPLDMSWLSWRDFLSQYVSLPHSLSACRSVY